jgi:hypothetical protein
MPVCIEDCCTANDHFKREQRSSMVFSLGKRAKKKPVLCMQRDGASALAVTPSVPRRHCCTLLPYYGCFFQRNSHSFWQLRLRVGALIGV